MRKFKMKDINATVLVDLKPNEEEMLKELHKDARWGINRAKKEGLIVEKVRNDEEWDEFCNIYKKTMEEGESIPARLEDIKKNSAVLFLCKKNEKIIAGAAIWFANKYKKEIPRLYLNASLKEYLNLQPNNLLYWQCILWCKKKGYDKFDLGGYQIKPRGHLAGINKFKEKWGKVIYFKKNYPIHVAIGRKLIRNFDIFWKLNKRLKRKH